MNNPMLQALNQNGLLQIKNNAQQVKQMMNAVRNMSSPQGMMKNVMMQNPQMREVMQYVERYGGDAQKAFYSLAEQKGVNPQEVLNMLK